MSSPPSGLDTILPASDVTTEPPTPPVLSWNAIQAVQNAIPETYKDPNCRAIQQVAEILNSAERCSHIQQLMCWQSALERIVDDVVGKHHNSFSSSIKKYAEIVHLFERSHQNVTSLRRILNAAASRLSTDLLVHNPIELTLHQSLVLRELAKKLSQLERLTSVPKELSRKLERGQFKSAVDLAIEAKYVLRIIECLTVSGAFNDLHRECIASSEVVGSELLISLLDTLFCKTSQFRRVVHRVLRDGGIGENFAAGDYQRYTFGAKMDAEASDTPCFRWMKKSSVKSTTTNMEPKKVAELEFLLTPPSISENVKADIQHLLECLFRMQSTEEYRVIGSVLESMRREMDEIVCETLLYCCLRKDVIISFAVHFFGTATSVSSQFGEAFDEAESTAAISLITECIFNSFRLVFLNLQFLDSQLSKTVPGSEVYTCATCAFHAMASSFKSAMKGLIQTEDSAVDVSSSVTQMHRSDAWWQKGTLPSKVDVTIDESSCALRFFKFQRTPGDQYFFEDTSLPGVERNTTDFIKHQALDDISERNEIEHQDVFAAARHLRTVLGITYTAQTWDKVSEVIHLLLSEMTS